MSSILKQLRDMTTVVADTGELDAVRDLKPVDCTTNPSLVLKAFDDPVSGAVLRDEVATAKAKGLSTQDIAARLSVALGAQLAQLVPGRVSTEVAANLSCDTKGSVARAREIMDDYAARGITSDRILIKLAATWEGIRAAQILQKDGIDCNLTLIFSLEQALAAADAGAYLISPFVGRITDWHKAQTGVEGFSPDADPGVASVREIYVAYKSTGIKTIVMGASFRNTGQIIALAGCDNLTISPALLAELEAQTGTLERALSPQTGGAPAAEVLSEAQFRWAQMQDAMADRLLTDGIRQFHKDDQTLLKVIDR